MGLRMWKSVSLDGRPSVRICNKASNHFGLLADQYIRYSLFLLLYGGDPGVIVTLAGFVVACSFRLVKGSRSESGFACKAKHMRAESIEVPLYS